MEQFANIFGIDLGTLAGIGVAIMVLSNVLKIALKIKGRYNLISPALLSVVVGFGLFMPDILKSIIAGFLLWISAIGIWETGKKIAHKAATPEK